MMECMYTWRLKEVVDKKWMSHKPNCIEVPVASAVPIQKRLYRFVSNENPIAEDFLPSCVSPRQRRMWSKRCLMPAFHGTSFFESEQAAIQKKKELPQAFDGLNLAVGDIEYDQGVAKVGRSEQVTLWFYENVFPKGFILL
jgi:hypothetical protein